MAPVLSDLAKSAPDQVAQRVAAVEGGLKACLAQSPDLDEATQGHWQQIVDAFVNEAKAFAAERAPTAAHSDSP